MPDVQIHRHSRRHATMQHPKTSADHTPAVISSLLALTIVLWLAHLSYSVYVLFFDDSQEDPSISRMLSR